MPDKLSIIVDELLVCGENSNITANDGTREWNVCSAAYDAGVEYALDKHDWKFGTAIEEVQGRTDSPDPNYADQYAKPNGCLHIVWVRDTGGSDIDWRIVGNRILVNQDDGILVKFVEEPGPTEWPGAFLKAIRHFVKAGIYRGLKQDQQGARSEEKAAEIAIAEARPRGDSEEPSRARFVSGLASARSRRRG